jgi:hypothetical protein
MEELGGMNRSRRHSRSRSRRYSGHRSRSHSPPENPSDTRTSQEKTNKQTQFIPIPIPYYQPPPPPPPPPPPSSSLPATAATVPSQNTLSNSNLFGNGLNQPISYILQQPKPQFMEEFIQPNVRRTHGCCCCCCFSSISY